MSDNVNPTIFLSYSWKNVSVADEIDNDFKSIGITFKRDVRDAPYRTSIKEFMQQIGKTDFVLMIISDEYLRSENCMYEVTELLNTHEFNKRVLPIILANAREMFSASERMVYYDYWAEKLEKAKFLKGKHTNLDYVEHEKKYNNIYNHLDIFFQLVIDLNVSTHENLKRENYRPLLNVVGFDDEKLLEDVLAIDQIESIQEKELALEDFLFRHPANRNGLFLKAYIAQLNKQYIKSKKYYKNLLEKYPNDIEALNNLSILLDNHFNDFSGAKNYCEMALHIDPDDADTHNNLGLLFYKRFYDFTKARQHYEAALNIDSNYATAYINLGILLKEQFFDKQGAKQHYLTAISLDPSLKNKERDKFFAL
jgi:tetratricopeptide (TPR) repeat protein